MTSFIFLFLLSLKGGDLLFSTGDDPAPVVAQAAEASGSRSLNSDANAPQPAYIRPEGYPVTVIDGVARWVSADGKRWSDRGYGLFEDRIYGRTRQFRYSRGRMYDFSLPGKHTGFRIWVFTATWCGPCQRAKQEIVPRLEERGYLVETIDFDFHPQLVEQYKVTAVPTWFVFHNDTVLLRSSAAQLSDLLSTLPKP